MKKRIVIIAVIVLLCITAGTIYYISTLPDPIEGTKITLIIDARDGSEAQTIVHYAEVSTLGAVLDQLAEEGKITGYEINMGYINTINGIQYPLVYVNSDDSQLVLLDDAFLAPFTQDGITFYPVAKGVNETTVFEGAVFHFFPYSA